MTLLHMDDRKVLYELVHPNEAALEGRLTGPTTIPKVLLCQCLLSFQPGMSTKD